MAKMKIGPHDVEVAYDLETDDHGSFIDSPPTITLGSECLDNETLRYTTLLHEALHAILTFGGLSELLGEHEELVVRNLEFNLSSLLRDNPEFAVNLVTALTKQTGESV